MFELPIRHQMSLSWEHPITLIRLCRRSQWLRNQLVAWIDPLNLRISRGLAQEKKMGRTHGFQTESIESSSERQAEPRWEPDAVWQREEGAVR
jgi:hypothetical protein